MASFLDFFRRPAEAPQQGEPRGTSGRAHSNGFLDFEEFNAELRHPQAHRVYDRMYRTDGDVRAAISLVTNPILAGTWQVVPYGGEDATEQDVAVADFVRWALFEEMSPNWLGHLAQFLPVLCRSGFAPGEKVWGLVDYHDGTRKLVLKQIGMRLPRSIWRFEQNHDGTLKQITQILYPGNGALADIGEPIRTQGGGGSGPGNVIIPAKDLVYYRVGAEGDNWEGVSMLRPAYKHWKMKDAIERLDAIAQERESIGIPVLWPPTGADPATLDDLEQTLQAMRTNEQGYIIMPGPKATGSNSDTPAWGLELMGYDRTGSGRDPQPSLAYHTQKISSAFIAEFMRLGHGQTGARATGQTQVEPFLMGVEALTGVIEQEANANIIAPLVAYNFPAIKNAPRLQMSLVDSTSLTQLADYVLKLTQVGALLPDQELEDFLRARADLPPANPDAVKQRRIADEQAIRRAVMGVNAEDPTGGLGGGDSTDPFGSNDKGHGGQHHGDRRGGAGSKGASPTKGGAGGGQNGAAGGAGGAGSGAGRGPNKDLSVTLDDIDDDDYLSRSYRRPLHPSEYVLDLQGIEDELDQAPEEMCSAVRPHVMALARGDAAPDLADDIHARLAHHYASGARHVKHELWGPDVAGPMPGYAAPPVAPTLARAIDEGAAGLRKRAQLAADHVRHAVDTARQGSMLEHDDEARAQAAGEKAGMASAKRAGRAHGTAAFMAGRHDMALDNADSVLGARYVCLLDRNSCSDCVDADDGEVRALDDPVRVDRRPPNHNCASMASGDNRCRCFEVYEPMPPGDGVALDAVDVPNDPLTTNWVEQAGGLPPYIAAIAGDLITERGMDVSRAIATAIARVKLWSLGGGKVTADTRSKATEALSEWEAMKAGS